MANNWDAYFDYENERKNPKTNKINNAESKAKVRANEGSAINAVRKNKGLRDQLGSILGMPLGPAKNLLGINANKDVNKLTGIEVSDGDVAKSAASTFLGNRVATSLFDAIDTPRAAAISGLNEIAKLANNNLVHNPSFQPSDKGFLDNMWSNMSTGEFLSQNTAIAKFAEDHPKAFGLSTLLADIAIDPLPKAKLKVGRTTSADALAARYVQEYADDYIKGASAPLLNQTARTAAQQAAATTGKNAAMLINDPAIQKSAVAATAGNIGRNATAITSDLAQEGKYVSLHFGDYELGKSRLAYKPVAATKRVLANSWLDKAFNPKTGMADELFTAQRQAEIYNGRMFNKHESNVRGIFKGLNTSELKQLTLSREAGTPAINKVMSNGRTYQDMLSEVDNLFQDMWNKEVAAGMHAGKAYDPRYVYKHMLTADPAKAKLGKAATTIGEAQLLGAKPLTRIDDVVSARLGKHYADIAQSSFIKQTEKMYGKNVDDIVAAAKATASQYKYTEKQGRALMDSALQDAGYKPVKGEAAKFMKQGTMIPDTVQTALDKYFKIQSSPEEVKRALNYFDRAQKQWKFLVTVPNPSHHFRNLLSDIMGNYYDDVGPVSYAEVVRSATGKGFDMKLGSLRVRNHIIDDLYETTGSAAGYTASEFNAPSHFKIKNFMRGASDVREEFARKAHFYDAIKKEAKDAKNWDDVQAAAERARDRVWTINQDYGATTTIQKNYLSRVMPFYSWLRKNIELQLMTLLKRPGKLSIMPRTTQAIEILMGQNPNEKPEMEWYMPEWMRELSPIQVGGGDNPIYSTLNLPMSDPFKLLGDFDKGPVLGMAGLSKEMVNSFSPILKSAYEATYEKSLLTGAPQTRKQQAVRALPFLRIASNYIPALREETDTPTTQQNIPLANWLTGLGLQELSDPRKQQGIKEHKKKVDDDNKRLEAKIREALG